MKIAIVGTRGIPARYGGFETFAEQIACNLAQRGHEVIVYCRKAFTRPDDVVPPGIRRVILPSIQSKNFDTLFHSCISTLHVLATDADVVLMCNVANSLYAWLPTLFGKPTILNVDGLDRKRDKWSAMGRAFLHMCEVLSTLTPTRVVTDAKVIQQYYQSRYRKQTRMIAYGADVKPGSGELADFGVTSRDYFLYVSRLEPENSPELVLRAYRELDTDWPLLVVGDNAYSPDYVRRLKAMADRRVIFAGSVYGDRYWLLQNHAGVYISGCRVGGTHPALLEAMAAGNPVLYLETAESDEVTRGCAIPYHDDPRHLTAQMANLLRNPQLRSELGKRAQHMVAAEYSWAKITRQYEELCLEVLRGRRSPQRTKAECGRNEKEVA
jgi:glycosyltransferase involved in cell wall biosynthesis